METEIVVIFWSEMIKGDISAVSVVEFPALVQGLENSNDVATPSTTLLSSALLAPFVNARIPWETWRSAIVVLVSVDLNKPGRLDVNNVDFGSGVSKNSCLPQSTVQVPGRQDTRGDGETSSMSLFSSGERAVLSPYSEEAEQTLAVCLDLCSVSVEVSANTCWSLGTHA